VLFLPAVWQKLNSELHSMFASTALISDISRLIFGHLCDLVKPNWLVWLSMSSLRTYLQIPDDFHGETSNLINNSQSVFHILTSLSQYNQLCIPPCTPHICDCFHDNHTFDQPIFWTADSMYKPNFILQFDLINLLNDLLNSFSPTQILYFFEKAVPQVCL
jgi:hypothetical protein